MTATTRTTSDASAIEVVAETLEGYAKRGIFRGFSRGESKRGKVRFKMLWHRDRVFELHFDVTRGQLRFKQMLPNVPSDSPMYAEFKKFVKARQSEDLPEHRRIDKGKAEIKPYNRGEFVSLSLVVQDGDYEYGARKIVHLVNEVFLDFLYGGMYYDYMVENFDLDPDQV